MEFFAGQRWVSDSEPELGLGIVLKVDCGVVDILFPAVEERRNYAAESAPLRRVIFSEGDTILIHDKQEHKVLKLKEKEHRVIYVTAAGEFEEGELCDTMSLNNPYDRILGGAVENDRQFRLRIESLYRNSLIKGSALRGMVGERADLIPHQISIVNEVAKRMHPRALLADEVGLGKTIEACMIMHRLHLTGRADRVLIVLPESLTHQWFVELLRRFNLLFSIFDEVRCLSIEMNNEMNPFHDSQLVIASIDFLTSSPSRTQQVVDAGWDMLIVDEAHHLEWSEEEVSQEYALVDQLASQTEAVLLLTATPQQLGPEGHFARLRLLDPDRFSDLQSYLDESELYEPLAKLLKKLSQGEVPSKAEVKQFSKHSKRVQHGMQSLLDGNEEGRNQLMEDLLDGFGPGRVMFRNTREHLTGFPNRIAHLERLEDKGRVAWLVEMLRDMPEEKILLIVKTKEEVERIAAELQSQIQVNLCLFHEELTLLQRDRNAAYFADEEGAQILLCSEIGSEGRNFQFAHHLVLFDLPEDPELLEQRIGRLDRIGQEGEIHIHVPFVADSHGEVLARWYDGLNAFEHNLHGATEIYHQCEDKLEKLRKKFSTKKVDELVAFSKKSLGEVTKKLMSGQEQLLTLNSFRSQDSEKIITKIHELDDDRKFEKFCLRLLDHLGVGIEDINDSCYVLTVNNMKTDLAADIPDEGLAVTFDREVALSREEMSFLSLDHPLILSALEVLLAGEDGNACFGMWEGTGEKGVYLEAYFVLEAIAPASLGVDRFLSAKPLRVVVDHAMKDCSEHVGIRKARLREGNLRKLLTNATLKQKVIPAMLETAEKLVQVKADEVVSTRIEEMQTSMQNELERLRDLEELHSDEANQQSTIIHKEIAQTEEQTELLAEALKGARVRLDSLKLIWRS